VGNGSRPRDEAFPPVIAMSGLEAYAVVCIGGVSVREEFFTVLKAKSNVTSNLARPLDLVTVLFLVAPLRSGFRGEGACGGSV